MALNLYRRHYDLGRCAGGHPPNTQTYESDELRPKWKKCGCPIYASGRLAENPKFRKNTKRFLWAEARTVADAWERGVSVPAPEPPPLPGPDAKPRTTIEQAVQACLDEYESNGSALSTQRAYATALRRFRKFSSDQKGYVYLDQWQPNDVRDMRGWWKGLKPRSWRTMLAKLKSFFELGVENGWVEKNPARIKVRRNRAQTAADQPNEKSPFTDAELRRMLNACPQYVQRQGRRSDWGGEDLEDFMLLSIYTGLRISDVALFHISRLSEQGDVRFRALKNDKWVEIWIPEWLQVIVRERAQRPGHQGYVFGKPVSTRPQIVTSAWRKRLNRFWSMTGPWKERPTHHRFRHTFVRMLLEAGIPPTKVAELLGDTEEVVRENYSKWVPERQEQIRRALQEAFAGMPDPTRPRLTRVK
jgi:integrase